MSEPYPRFRMVDIGQKTEEHREAVATGRLRLREDTIELLRRGRIEKGDPLSAAEIAAIAAAKKTSELIPLCHQLQLTEVKATGEVLKDHVAVKVTVKTTARTGVEMEALTAASIYLLTVWDMTKQYEKDEKGQYPLTAIEDIRIVRKVKDDAR